MKRMCCFNLLGGLALSLMTFIVWWHWEWVVSSSGESGSTILRNLGFVYGGLIAIWVAVWRSVVADRQAEASKRQAESSLQLAKAAQDQADTSQHGLLNERFQRGAEMLGSPVLSVRLGGIYALQRLAEEEPEQYHIQIMLLLSAFVRNPNMEGGNDASPMAFTPDPKIKEVREDVLAAMRAIGTRSAADIELEEKANFHVNLIGAYLAFANLTDANLTRAYLLNVNLTGAVLSKAKGLTQGQLDLTRADSAHPPHLNEAYDAETRAPLRWRGPPPLK